MKFRAALCTAYCALIYAAALWPFDFRPDNRVSAVPGQPGLHFGKPAVIHSAGSVSLAPGGPPDPAGGEFSIELWLKSDNKSRSDLPQIVTLDDDQSTQPLLIGQWKSFLVMRLRTADAHFPRHYRELFIADIFKSDTTHIVTITRSKTTTRFFVDGQLKRIYRNIVPLAEPLRGTLILGDSGRPSTGEAQWEGQILGVAFYSTPLSAGTIREHRRDWTSNKVDQILKAPGIVALYRLRGRTRTIADLSGHQPPLVIPTHYSVLRKSFLFSDWRNPKVNFSHHRDVILNVLGFVPFGFLLAWAAYPERRLGGAWKLALPIIIAGSFFSLSIETVQVFLYMRDSSITDLITNTLGTAIGTIAALGIVRRRKV